MAGASQAVGELESLSTSASTLQLGSGIYAEIVSNGICNQVFHAVHKFCCSVRRHFLVCLMRLRCLGVFGSAVNFETNGSRSRGWLARLERKAI